LVGIETQSIAGEPEIDARPSSAEDGITVTEFLLFHVLIHTPEERTRMFVLRVLRWRMVEAGPEVSVDRDSQTGQRWIMPLPPTSDAPVFVMLRVMSVSLVRFDGCVALRWDRSRHDPVEYLTRIAEWGAMSPAR
jgi:hypothetical protein